MSGSGIQKREGLQVVKVSQEPGRRYEVDEEALASVLLHPDVRSLPVVVLSVAGPYRGGKSFILDFFLRYLTASEESRITGQWLGKEDEVLDGFDWRGGVESHTKGIYLWPEPIIIANERTGEKVAVLLMDTQGTFDMENDMGDNSTIFALSTLLSSVQIYNLRSNIGENDLQHLQLFTEYGRLACNAHEKAFQTLLFLVRDWMSAFEYPHGYSGGEGLLNKKLAPRPQHTQELRKVRDHIHSCFNKLQCFLMPHPGLIVADEEFKGHIRDISERFRTSLLELVPSVFEPNNLTPKVINGEKVQTQGLLEFFKQYVEMFNGDDLPKATTIFQATADACMMATLRESRQCYENKMKTNILQDQSVSSSIVQNWHNVAVTAAIAYFQDKKKLGTPNDIAVHLADLQKELGARLSLYLWQNDAKLRDTLTEAKKAYEDVVSAVCGEQIQLCLHVRDLQALHPKALRAALTVFERSRTKVPQQLDTERRELIEDLEKHYDRLCGVNAQNNRTAALEAREMYLSRMKEGVNQKGVSSDQLKRQHEEASKTAIDHFLSLRNLRTEETDDPDLARLKQDIETYLGEFQRGNSHNNMWAVQSAEYAYNNSITSAWGAPSCCFNPRALKDVHDEALDCALQRFRNNRIESEEDDFEEKLIANLEARYEDLQKINDFNNKQILEQVFGEYTRQMDKHSQPSLSSILVVPFLIKTFGLLPRYHEQGRTEAVESFFRRRRGRSYADDEYVDKLHQTINQAYAVYRNPLLAVIRELGLQHLLQLQQ